MKANLIKGLIAAIIGALATIYGTEGATVAFYAVSVFAAVVSYFVQHAILKPITVFGQIDLTDVLKGALMAIGTAAGTYAASLLAPEVVFTFQNFLDVLGAALVAYLAKNIFSNSKGELGPEKR